MNCRNTLVCLLHENVTNLREAIKIAEKASCNMVIGPVTHPQFCREFQESRPMVNHHKIFTRSDLLLSANDWMLKYIMHLSPSIDCDSSDAVVRANSERVLHQELAWSKHLAQNGCFVVRLQPGAQSVNLARNLNGRLEQLGCLLVQLPWTNIRNERNRFRANKNRKVADDGEWDPWCDWNRFRLHCDFNKRVKIILEITHDLPTTDQLNRWLGEPIEMIIIPHSLFSWSQAASYHLPPHYMELCKSFMHRLNVHVAIKCPADDCNIAQYAAYLRNVANTVFAMQLNQSMMSFTNDDRLILSKHKMNQIDFGKNVNVTGNRATVVKAYEQALALAMQDIARKSEAAVDSKLSVMIIGPGCSELLPIVLATSKHISQKLNLFIFDEDECVNHAMARAIEYFFPNEDIQLISSRRQPQLDGKMHIIVSMPFESMYHSQWLQYNFDQVKHFLGPDGVVIPQQSSLSIVPIMSSKIHNKVRHGEIFVDSKEVDVLHYEKRSQTIFAVFPRNFYECAAPKLMFSFELRPNHRMSFCHATETETVTVTFDTKLECVVVGFFGYFAATLYRHIEVSNQKMNQMDDIVCPALTFYPLASPQHLLAKQRLHVTFRYCFDANRNWAWLEWSTHDPIASEIHNFMGRSHRMSFRRKDRVDDGS